MWGNVLEWFVDEDDKYGFRKFEPIAKDVLRLYDYVRFKFKEKYNAPTKRGKPGRFGGRKETKVRKRGSQYAFRHTTFSNLKKARQFRVTCQSRRVWLSPSISGFRVLIQEKKGKFDWLTDPFQFFDAWGTKLARTDHEC